MAEGMGITEVIEEQYKPYAKYVVESRAIPRLSDGLKPVQRRVLWVGKRGAKDLVKVAKLGGATTSLHPHGNTAIEDTISNMAQNFTGTNNIPWFEGKGQFGSRLTGPGKGIASARYVAVKLSQNFNAIFEHDTDLIKMIPNYDETESEPQSFLPIVPPVLLNPIQGIAVGFACNILPRDIEEVKKAQINYLLGKNIKSMKPYYKGFKGEIVASEKEGQWITSGVWELKGNTLHITELPIGTNRESFVSHLDKLEERDIISGYHDNCKEDFDFLIKLKKKDIDIETTFKLKANLNENITLIGFNDEVLERLTDVEVIQKFTDWRFSFYLQRFEKLLEHTDDELEFRKALLLVIKKGLFKTFPSQTRKEIVENLRKHSIKDDHIKRILQIPIYRFGKEEVVKLENEVKDLEMNKKEYTSLVKSEEKRKDFYVKEIKSLKGIQ